MMGTHHAITGAAAWVAVTSTATQIPTLGWHPLGPVSVVLGAVVCAGAALLPDADHHNATIAHSLPGVGRLATGAVRAASGGHRHGTHSLLSAILVLGTALWLAQSSWYAEDRTGAVFVGSAIAAAALLAFAVKVLTVVPGWCQAWAIGGTIAALISWLSPHQWEWLPLCIAIGWAAHLAGDFLTTGGLPLFWPLKVKAPRLVSRTPLLKALWSKGGYFALPILGNTGSWREWCLMVPLGIYALSGVGLEVWQVVQR
ncbi:metal-dependent hydrolase [Leifsonia sp. YAF41]|uniref:metal-dependent hydrolase n=1 Tax=Leifsonia sp. YAF41 TaxID=3233086 RepID=UPI003F972CD6